MPGSILKYTVIWIFLLLVQVLLLNNIYISGYLNPYMYVMFILLLPLETPKYLLLILGFLTGLSIDIFCNTPGMHASATTLMAFARPAIIRLVLGRDLTETNAAPRLRHMGLSRFLKYTVILVFIHHFFLFFVEMFTFEGFVHTLLRILLSSAFTIILIILSQFLVFRE